jgi:hypothetical protein
MKNVLSALAILAPLTLAACSGTAEQSNAKVQQVLDRVHMQGQLYCSIATRTGPLVVALASTSGVPVTVTGKAADVVAAACNVVAAVPVPPPADPAAAPVVAAAVPAAAMAR